MGSFVSSLRWRHHVVSLFSILVLIQLFTFQAYGNIVDGTPQKNSIFFFQEFTDDEWLIEISSPPVDFSYRRKVELAAACENGDFFLVQDKAILKKKNFGNLSDVDWIGDNRYLLTSRDRNSIFFYNTNQDTTETITYTPSQPTDADLLDNGQFLITEVNPSRVILVDSQGKIVWQYSGNLKNPRDAILLENGNVVISDFDQHRLIEVNELKEIVREIRGFDHPRKIELLPNGDILVADSDNHAVKKVTSDSELLTVRQNLNYVSSVHFEASESIYICSIINKIAPPPATPEQKIPSTSNPFISFFLQLEYFDFIPFLTFLGLILLFFFSKYQGIDWLRLLLIFLSLFHAAYLIYEACQTNPYLPHPLFLLDLFNITFLMYPSQTVTASINRSVPNVSSKPIFIHLLFTIAFVPAIVFSQYFYLANSEWFQFDWFVPNITWVSSIFIAIWYSSQFSHRRLEFQHSKIATIPFAKPKFSNTNNQPSEHQALCNSMFVFLIFIATLFFTLNNTEFPREIHGDEANVALHGLEQIKNWDLNFFRPSWFHIPNLFFQCQGFLVYFFGNNIAVLRLFGALTGLISLFFFYGVANLLFKPIPSLLGALVFCFSFYSLHFFRVGTGFTLATLMILVVLYFLIRSLKEGYLFHYFLTGVISGISILTYQPCKLIFPLVMLTYFILYFLVKNKWTFIKLILISCCGYLIAVSPLIANHLFSSDSSFSRLSTVSILADKGFENVQIEYSEDEPFFSILIQQHYRAFMGIITFPDQGPFLRNYTYGGILDPITSIFFLTGFIYLVLDRNLLSKILVLWLLLFVSIGSGLTISAPAYQRFAITFPLLCLIAIPALQSFYIHVDRKIIRSKDSRIIFFLFLFGVVLFNISFNKYFIEIMSEPQISDAHSTLAKHIQTLPKHEKVVLAGEPHINSTYATIKFFNPNLECMDVNNVENEIGKIQQYIQNEECTIVLYRSNVVYEELIKKNFRVTKVRTIQVPNSHERIVSLRINETIAPSEEYASGGTEDSDSTNPLQGTQPEHQIPSRLRNIIQKPVDAVNLPLAQLIPMLENHSGLKFQLETDKNPPLTFFLSHPSVKEVLDTVLPAYDLAYRIDENGSVHIADRVPFPPLSELPDSIQQALGKRIEGPINAETIDCQRFLMFLRNAGDFQMVLGSNVNQAISIRLNNPTIYEALKTILPTNGLGIEAIENNVIAIYDPRMKKNYSSNPPYPKQSNMPEQVRQNFNQRIEGLMEGVNTDLLQVLKFLHETGNLQMVLEPGIERTMTYSLNQPTLYKALQSLLPPNGLGFHVFENGAVYIYDRATPLAPSQQPPFPDRSTLSKPIQEKLETVISRPIIETAALPEILTLLEEASGLHFRLNHKGNKLITIFVNKLSVFDLLQILLMPNGLTFQVEPDETIHIYDPYNNTYTARSNALELSETLQNALQQQIDGPVDIVEVEIQDIVSQIEKIIAITIVVEEEVSGKVNCSLNNPSLQELLETILPQVAATYKAQNDTTIRIVGE